MTNLNIRVSISILVARLITIDLLAAFIVAITYFLLLRGDDFFGLSLSNTYLFLVFSAFFGLIKILTTVYIVLQWLNEYYEISHDAIVHKSGIIFKKTEKYNLENVRAMTVHYDILGEIFNYGTITLFDIRMNKYLDLYQIHNPNRYVKVLQSLKPKIELKEEIVSLKRSIVEEVKRE